MKDFRLLPVAALAVAAVVTVAGCSDSADAPDSQDSSSTSSTSSQSTEPSSSEAEESSETASTSAADSADASDFKDASIAEAYDIYGDLAPRELFEQLNDCQPNGLPNSKTCTGPKVGTFQFMSSKTKAVSVMQALTEFSNSQVVEKSEDRVVGWSIMGTTAIVTVVNKDKGLLLQQMVSTDDVDPEERIYELGLAQQPEQSQAETSETNKDNSEDKDTKDNGDEK
ncbi:hypothetical protein CCICO_08800 [Corynebacterium ciconiae DSM 44920]|uniref:hypothetical protein n=1 Tax=Corynebacterium ciconiae TaxID=227319 RepID=UPI000375E4F8|nr:hypothetical protein [Corynebacterium ciconiae]WKD61768.1 hypothetical protein CCICO_08800 [Corynebacterium ciconiae DSM 44920]